MCLGPFSSSPQCVLFFISWSWSHGSCRDLFPPQSLLSLRDWWRPLCFLACCQAGGVIGEHRRDGALTPEQRYMGSPMFTRTFEFHIRLQGEVFVKCCRVGNLSASNVWLMVAGVCNPSRGRWDISKLKHIKKVLSPGTVSATSSFIYRLAEEQLGSFCIYGPWQMKRLFNRAEVFCVFRLAQ